MGSTGHIVKTASTSVKVTHVKMVEHALMVKTGSRANACQATPDKHVREISRYIRCGSPATPPPPPRPLILRPKFLPLPRFRCAMSPKSRLPPPLTQILDPHLCIVCLINGKSSTINKYVSSINTDFILKGCSGNWKNPVAWTGGGPDVYYSFEDPTGMTLYGGAGIVSGLVFMLRISLL